MGASLVTAKYGWLEIGDIRKGFVNFQARLLKTCPICDIKHEKDQLYGFLFSSRSFMLRYYRQKQYKLYMKPKLNHFGGRNGRNSVEMFRPKTPESRNRVKMTSYHMIFNFYI